MSETGLLVYGLVGFIMSVLSGATGGGGGFILTPLMIFLGLSPAQAVANGKFGGIFVTIGSLAGLRKHKLDNTKLVWTLVVIAVVIGLIAPRFIVSIDPETYENILGILLVLLSPLIVYKKLGHKSSIVSPRRKLVGITMITLSMFLVGIFSGGLGIFINVAMMSFLGMNSLDASVTKRYSMLFLHITIIVGLISSGLFILNVALVSLLSSTLGGYTGGKLAIKKGSKFVSTMIAIAAFASGLYLLLT